MSKGPVAFKIWSRYSTRRQTARRVGGGETVGKRLLRHCVRRRSRIVTPRGRHPAWSSCWNFRFQLSASVRFLCSSKRAPPRSWTSTVGGRDFENRPGRPSLTDEMELRHGCTLSLPLLRMPSPQGSDQVPAARCVFGDEQRFLASVQSYWILQCLLSHRSTVQSLAAFSCPSVIGKKWNDRIRTKTFFVVGSRKSQVLAHSRGSLGFRLVPRRRPMETRTASFKRAHQGSQPE